MSPETIEVYTLPISLSPIKQTGEYMNLHDNQKLSKVMKLCAFVSVV